MKSGTFRGLGLQSGAVNAPADPNTTRKMASDWEYRARQTILSLPDRTRLRFMIRIARPAVAREREEMRQSFISEARPRPLRPFFDECRPNGAEGHAEPAPCPFESCVAVR